MRAEFTKKTKLKAFHRSQGRCESCTVRLYPGRFEYDHVTPCSLGGNNSLKNCEVLCRECHNSKSGGHDIPQIRKADRQKARHVGAKKRKGRPMDGSRDSRWKKRMDGRVERR